MNLRGDKYARFSDCNSENSDLNSNSKLLGLGFRKPSLRSITGGIRQGFERGGESLSSIADKIRRGFNRDSESFSFSSITDGIRRGLERGGERLSSITDKIRRGFAGDSESSIAGGIRRRQPSPKNNRPETKTILDPQGSFLQRWNKIFVLSCIIAVSLDPLFFYIPVIIGDQFYLSLDKKIEIPTCGSPLTGRRHLHIPHLPAIPDRIDRPLVHDSKAIAERYLCSYFIIDILLILPAAGILLVRHVVKGPVLDVTKELLKVVIFIQYIPRFWRIYPLYQEVTTTSGIFIETAWAGAAFNLFL